MLDVWEKATLGLFSEKMAWSPNFLVALVILLGTAANGQNQCPQNLGSCKCIRPSVPGAALKPVLDCSQISDASDLLQIEGLRTVQSGGVPVFSQIIIRRSQLEYLPSDAFGIARADEIIIENNPQLEKIEARAFGMSLNPRLISIRSNPLLETIEYEGFDRSVTNIA